MSDEQRADQAPAEAAQDGGQLGQSSGLAPQDNRPQPGPGGVRADVSEDEAVINDNFGERNLSADGERPGFWSGAGDQNAEDDAGMATGGGQG